MPVKYICSDGRCRAVKQTDKQKPDEWFVHRQPELFQKCPDCGQFMVPEELMPSRGPLDRQHFFMFAGCMNAYECNLFDQYGSECEQGKVMTKCFHAIHQKQDIQADNMAEYDDRLARVESLLQKLLDPVSSQTNGKKPH